MTGRWALVALAAVAAAPAAARADGYGAGVSVARGTALGPPGVGSGTSGALVLREIDGPIGRLLLAFAAAGGVRDGGYDTQGRKVYVVTGSPEAGAILAGQFATDLTVEIWSRAAGGDTSGFMVTDLMGLPFESPLRFAFGIQFGYATAHDRPVIRAVRTADGIMAQETIEDVSNKVIGTPLRITGHVHPAVAAYVQLDLNYMALSSDFFGGARNLTRYGAITHLGPIELTIEAQSQGLTLENASLSVQATVGTWGLR